MAAHLIDSNLTGHDSHGVIRAPQYLGQIETGLIVPGASSEVVRETETTTLLRGNWNYGQVVGREAMDIAIAKARASGIGITVAWEISHTGRMGTYGEQAAREGMLAIATVQGQGRIVAPFGGAEGPALHQPDRRRRADPRSGAAVRARHGHLGRRGRQGEGCRRRRLRAAPGLGARRAGRPTRDPSAIEAGGAILPLGGPAGHKGFGLSLAVTALGALAPQGALGTHRGSSTVMLAVDLERFREPSE